MAAIKRDLDKESFWRQIVRKWDLSSGLSVPDFCDQHGVAVSTFYAWRRTITQRDEEMQADFVPLHVAPTPTNSVPLELVLNQGHIIRVTPGFDATTLKQLLAILEEPSC